MLAGGAMAFQIRSATSWAASWGRLSGPASEVRATTLHGVMRYTWRKQWRGSGRVKETLPGIDGQAQAIWLLTRMQA